MDSSKKKRYDKLIEELGYVKGLIDSNAIVVRGENADSLVAAAILVASEHSIEDLSYSCESKTKITGQKMKEYRLSHGLTQEQLAKQLGISRPYMSEIESNKRSMSVKTIKNFTDKLGITLSDFFN